MSLTARGGTIGLVVLLTAVSISAAAPDTGLERLATCQDSWRDWQKANDPKLASFAARLRADFTQKDGDAFLTPKSATTLAGYRVLQVYPDSVGMGVGFSVVIDAKFDDAKARFTKIVGKPLAHCETSDGMRSCDVEIASERTFTLMASDQPDDTKTLAGCYYYYEK